MLFLREDVEKGEINIYDFYINAEKLATKFLTSGYSELDKYVSDTLMGIINMKDTLSFAVTKSLLKDLMNDIDRGE
ncbi:MAG: hypothetical protein PHN69_06140 [Candidatus Pacebacteria bacterium]|nr:hypothetical protein [Candidatus Paceibacterota bacterium]